MTENSPGRTGGFTAYTCGLCGEEFTSNCSPGDIECTGCEARRCPHCETWYSELGDVSTGAEFAAAMAERDSLREQLDRCAGLLGTANHSVTDLRALVAEICDDLDRHLVRTERIVFTAEDMAGFIAEWRQRGEIGDGH